MNVCLGRVHAASYNTNRIGGVMVRVIASSAVDRGFEPRDLKTLLALFLKQKRVRKFTWLDPIQCEQKYVRPCSFV
jgi:hypothetical protein